MEEAVNVLVANLRATKRMWSQAAGDFVKIPDGPTQVEAAKTMLAYGIGQPVQRLISVTTPENETTEDVLQKLKQSRAMRKSLRDMVDKAEAAPARCIIKTPGAAENSPKREGNRRALRDPPSSSRPLVRNQLCRLVGNCATLDCPAYRVRNWWLTDSCTQLLDAIILSMFFHES